MSVAVFKFAEVIEGTYLGAKKIRWRELVQIRKVDDVSTPVEYEYDLVTEYYEPVSTLLVTKASGGADGGDSAIMTLDGGFNFGDTLSVEVSLDGAAMLPISVMLDYIATASEAAQILAEEIAVQLPGAVVESQFSDPESGSKIDVWSAASGGTVTLSTPMVARATVTLPDEVKDFLLAVKNLDY